MKAVEMTVENHSCCVQQKSQGKYNNSALQAKEFLGQGHAERKRFAAHRPRIRHTLNSPALDCHTEEVCTVRNSMYL